MAKNGKHFRALEEAKAAGYRVRVAHQRYDMEFEVKFAGVAKLPEPYHANLWKVAISRIPARAITAVVLLDEFGEEVGMGTATCSWKDNFNRRLGVQIACGRALKAAQGR